MWYDTPSTAGSDFVAVNKTVFFSPTEGEVCVTLEIIDDNVTNELPEHFILNFSVDQMGLTLPPVSITILDNDVTGGPVYISLRPLLTNSLCSINVGSSLYIY